MNEFIANKITTLLNQLEELSSQELAWLSGYCWAKSQAATEPVVTAPLVESTKIHILSASQTGNARKVAEDLQLRLQENDVYAQLSAVGDYKSKNLSHEDVVIIVTSTQGEGEPPEEAISLYKFLFGKKAPNLEQLSFAVLGLGDSSYPNYCQAGVDFDQQLAKLGAKRLLDRVDCDLEFEQVAQKWIVDIVAVLSKIAASQTAVVVNQATTNLATNYTEHNYSKDHPCVATLSLRQKITADNANKDVEHIEIDLTDTGLSYQVGDALGVWYENDDQLITEIVDLCNVDKEAEIILKDKQKTTLYQGLKHHAEISQNSAQFVKAYARLINNKKLEQVIAENLQDYIDSTPLIGTIQQFPQQLNAQDLFDAFRALTPRMYSIASAAAEVGDEVHLTVGVVRYQYNGKTYTGGASGYLGEQLQEGDKLKVFVEANNQFRLPVDGHKPIIMIGAGTGIAPYRAFIQQREVNQDSGDNWLIFGNQKFTDDFLYQAEWQQYRQSGLLTRGDFAWSRQSKDKVYVQHKIIELGNDIWQYLEQGAYVYVCGDANNMAKDVESALLKVIMTQSNKDEEYAEEYLEQLREDKRYQRDVY